MSLTLRCWLCDLQSGGNSAVLSDGENVCMFKSGRGCHLTCFDEKLPQETYLRVHPSAEDHQVKPFRLHCAKCKNQLGVMFRSEGLIRPSFHRDSVIFRTNTIDNESNSQGLVSVQQWKYNYAEKNMILTTMVSGHTKTHETGNAMLFIMNKHSWNVPSSSQPRLQKDVLHDMPSSFDWRFSTGTSQYIVTEKSSLKIPGSESLDEVKVEKYPQKKQNLTNPAKFGFSKRFQIL